MPCYRLDYWHGMGRTGVRIPCSYIPLWWEWTQKVTERKLNDAGNLLALGARNLPSLEARIKLSLESRIKMALGFQDQTAIRVKLVSSYEKH